MQTELAQEIGVSPQLISDWKAGRRTPDPDQVFALEDALGQVPGNLSRHLGYRPTDRDAEASGEIAADAGRSIRDYLGDDLDIVLADIEDFDAFAREVVEDGLRRRLLRMVVDEMEQERGEPVSDKDAAWAREVIDRAHAAPQGLFEG